METPSYNTENEQKMPQSLQSWHFPWKGYANGSDAEIPRATNPRRSMKHVSWLQKKRAELPCASVCNKRQQCRSRRCGGGGDRRRRPPRCRRVIDGKGTNGWYLSTVPKRSSNQYVLIHFWEKEQSRRETRRHILCDWRKWHYIKKCGDFSGIPLKWGE